MSDDILAKAEALANMPITGGNFAYRYLDIAKIVAELVAEIKRLRENAAIYAGISDECEAFEDENIESKRQLAAKDLHITSLKTMAQATAESHLQFVDAHFEQEKKWEEESKCKDDEIRKWQEIAKETTARAMFAESMIPQPLSDTHENIQAIWRSKAAKELSIPHDSYLSRLEQAFTKLYILHLEGMDKDVAEKHAREALEKIRHARKP
jgi:hypothetical protein